ncbi:substrate-binding domain-containing protein [Rhizobium sp. NRK18]|uniref:LacI family DNA-binding transcriptional regulator n=1 Tax=Rhizobium sp. NRK18 TaxID=2964667 RepID=UPI0021C3293F|nr:substrate-binding domain-containing protein [Rhizobium sp. NRK18]MCQ2006310.1 substrate-binding domain-containing protein [Rhizobium sp. NRK18]
MAKKVVNSIDVARKAGVSRSAVSRTFTPGASVSPEVRAKVLKAAKALGYRVNRLAQSLNGSGSNLIGVVGANLSMPFIAKQLDLLSIGLLRKGMQCLLLNAADARQDIAPLIELIFEFRARAIVVLSGEPPNAIVEECRARGVKLILINRKTEGADTDLIMTDDVTGARLAGQQLVEAGCRKLAVVASGSRTPTQLRRAEEFRRYVGERGCDIVEWMDGPTTYETGLMAGRALLKAGNIDGVFCVTDLLAMGLLDAARHELGLRVPEDVSVVGFDDIPQAAWYSYDLTTIAQSFDHLTEAVLDAIEKDGPSLEVVNVPVELVSRSTVRNS